MSTEIGLYLVVIAAGAIAIALAVRSPALGLGCWLLLYPLAINFAVPVGLEKLPATRVITLILSLVLLPRLRAVRLDSTVRVAVLMFAAFLAFSALSAWGSEIARDSLLRTISYAEPILWLLIGASVVSEGGASKGILLTAVSLGFAVVLLISIPEVIAQANPLIALGIDKGNGDYMYDRRLGFTGRIVSTLGQPVYAGLYGVCCVAVAFYLSRDSNASTIRRMCLTIIAIAGAAFVFLTGTRAAIVGLLVLPVAYVVLSWHQGGHKKIISPFVLLLLLLLFAIPGSALEYWRDSLDVESYSAGSRNVLGRLYLTGQMFSVFREHPLLGVGPGYFQKALDTGGRQGLEGLSGVENQYATTLAENGALGTLLLLTCLTLLIYQPKRVSESGEAERTGPLARSVLASLGVMAVSCFVLTTAPMYVCLCLVGAGAASPREPRVLRPGT
jgi:hypothetical protein